MDHRHRNLNNEALDPPQTRLPLSSPLVEDAAHQFGVPSNPFESPDDRNNETTHDIPEEPHFESRWSTDSGSAIHGGRWSATKRLARASTKKQRKARPGLNLVTNFASSGHAAASKRRSEGSQHRSRDPTFFDWNDLRTLSRAKDQSKVKKDSRKISSWKRASRKGYEELTDEPHEIRTKKKIQELSPSDRPIVIGMRVPRDSVDVAEARIKDRDKQKTKPGAFQEDATPVTPTIVITPAEEKSVDAEWESSLTALRPPSPASSVYSQPTPSLRPINRTSIPPVPPLPDDHRFFSKTQASDDVFSDDKRTSIRRQRALSIGTVFEDESNASSPHNLRPRSLSDAARQRLWKGLSLETIATRRRSQGWWTYLLSPLLSRSNTIASPLSARSPPPPLPSAVSTQWSLLDEKRQPPEVSAFSPDTPENDYREKSARSDITRWPEWRSERGDAVSASPECMSERKFSPSSPASSSRTIPFVMSSPVTRATAQHCHACNNDYNNRAPYSGSIGHTCAASNILAQSTSSPSSGNTSTIQGPLTSINQNTNNPFFQRFVESLRNGNAMRPRPDSTSTTFEDEPDISPTVRVANVAPLLRADQASPIPARFPLECTREKAATPAGVDMSAGENSSTIDSSEPRSQPFDSSSPHRDKPVPRYKAIFPPDSWAHIQQPHSPGPITPGAHHIISGPGGYLMSENPQRPPPVHLPVNRAHSERSDSSSSFGACIPAVQTHTDISASSKLKRHKYEAGHTSQKTKTTNLWIGGCFGDRGHKRRISDASDFSATTTGRGKRKRWCILITVLLIILIIILATVLPIILVGKGSGGEGREGEQGDRAEDSGVGNARDDTNGENDGNDDKGGGHEPVDSRWLNLTGYPPMPTGISTIAGPQLFNKKSGCVRPATMWSCSLPKELHEANEPYDADRPLFKIQIAFQNGTFDHSTTVEPPSGEVKRMFREIFGAQRRFKRALIDDADPPPPSLHDMEFLGNTTDNITPPLFAGEETPFFASFLSPYPERPSPTVERRAATPSATNPFPNLTTIIPPPALDTDGTAAPAVLYPLPRFQPIRLYDRGLPTEHYGFYTYFDKSIFLKSTDPLDPSINGGGNNVQDDLDGGSTKSAARVMCTWAQTRFLVKIWTQPNQAGMVLLNSDDDDTPLPSSTSSDPEENFTVPGSFPYPISLILDRHGGSEKQKMVYCYGMDVRGNIDQDEKKLQLEFRNAGGTLINPASGIFNITRRETDEEGVGDGIDGGTGGCSCEWRNWAVG